MPNGKVVKDVMIDVFEYPHVPYWFTIKQAIGIIKKSLLGSEKCFHPLAVLVFDEKYNLMGFVTLKDILKGLEPHLFKTKTMADADVSYVDENALAGIEAGLFSSESKKLAEKPVSEIMVPVKTHVAPGDSVVKTAFLMVYNNTTILPVLENKQKLVGLVRMVEVYKEVSDSVIG